MTTLTFAAGTLELRPAPPPEVALPAAFRWDARSACQRAPASAYAATVLALRRAAVPFEDRARAYAELAEGARIHMEPRAYQREALAAWSAAGGRGVVVLPTGAGKTHVAVLALDLKRRDALVVTPTLDLVRQWYDILRSTFAGEVGVVGGGEYQVRPLTVTTYDSAYIHMENLGARFGTIVFDECHHLPGPAYSLAAELCIAPFRLGLTATPPDGADGREQALAALVGPVVYCKEISELAGSFLADYETVRVAVALSAAERLEYDAERGVYLAFLRGQGIRMSNPRGWSEFIMRAARSEAGRRALGAYRRQRELAFSAPAKLEYLEHLLGQHGRDRMLIFTDDNATAYRVSRRFLVPAITHQTRVTERSEYLAGFAAGSYGAIVTSRVLNEGIDVPDANVAVVLSGSGSVREHVQRLGRILRPRAGKRATLYEVVSADTGETSTSERRREHAAYR